MLPSHMPTADLPAILSIVACAARADQRTHWCREAAEKLCELLDAGAALVLDVVPASAGHRVESFLDVGLAAYRDRAGIIAAIGLPRIADTFLCAAIRNFAAQNAPAAAFTCGDLLTPAKSRRSIFCPRRANASFADCLISIAALTKSGRLSRHLSAVLFFKTNSTFTARENDLLALCHPALAEICAGRQRKSPQHTAALSPRLRQTLRHLASGKSERVIAQKMKLSYHTVHDYVKTLYAHFAVTSRDELLVRWPHV